MPYRIHNYNGTHWHIHKVLLRHTSKIVILLDVDMHINFKLSVLTQYVMTMLYVECIGVFECATLGWY
jgi:hypothetical protein